MMRIFSGIYAAAALRVLFFTSLLILTSNCRFIEIFQPELVSPGSEVTVTMRIGVDITPEPTAHRGVLCLLLPEDWAVNSAEYSSPLGNGILTLSQDWADSAEACYPVSEMADDMKWFGMISDTGYAYEDPFEINISVSLQAGQTEGCFDLGYIVTKATPNLICSGTPSWAPFSFPHPLSVTNSGETCDTVAVRRAPAWDDLLDRKSGWTGADGIYSIPLSGLEIPTNPQEKTLLLFSDTFIGEVDSLDQRSNTVLVNNTYAILDGTAPIDGNAEFFWATEPNGDATTIFVPNTPNANPDEWYWLMDGIALQDSIYVFGLRIKRVSGGLGFGLSGTALLSFVLDENDEISQYYQKDTPIYHQIESEGSELVFGQAILDMTARSGNPDPDGYIYIYGPKNAPGAKDLVAARVLPEHFPDFSEWRYWDGAGWSVDIENSAPITSNISQEFSVSPIGNGQFILVFQIGLGPAVGIRIGESPVGPFGLINTIYNAPEPATDSDIFTYNAKAHPHLSTAGELLISYNVNTFDFWEHFTNADIYRPRFIWLAYPGEGPVAITDTPDELPRQFALFQNYPNPFNPETHIRYQLPRAGNVKLTVFNILGQPVRTLVNQAGHPAGDFLVKWNGSDDFGNPVSTGVYFYRLELNGFSESRKLLFLK